MNMNMQNIAKGLAATAVVGTAAYAITKANSKKNKGSLKKNAAKAMKTVGTVMEAASGLIK